MRQETQTRKMWSSDPAAANPQMSAEEMVAHIKAQARPGQGGQTSTDASKMRRPTRNFDVVMGAKDAFNIAGAESLAANAFKVDGLAEAMAAEKNKIMASQKTTSSSLGNTDDFMMEYSASQGAELTSMESESSLEVSDSKSDWSIGSVSDLNSQDIGIEGIELQIPELDVSLSSDSATHDSEALDRTPKRNQFRSSNSS